LQKTHKFGDKMHHGLLADPVTMPYYKQY